jgi:ABC-type bacteriocin/lantibiotic exporter with double-glycine peptidase domain
MTLARLPLRLWSRMAAIAAPLRRPACVRQYGEEDCGAACLATICQSRGQRLPLALVRDKVGTSSQGTTLLGLKRGGEALGFHARPVKAGPFLLDQLDQVPLPAICHWRGNHWIVLHGQRGGRLIVADPAMGLRWLDRPTFLAGWGDGVLLLLEPDPLRFPLALRSEARRADGGQVDGHIAWRRYLSPFRGLLLQALALNLAIGILALALPLLMQIITDDVLIRGDQEMLRSLALGILLIFLFRSLLELLQGVLVAHFGQKLQLQMVLNYGRHLLQLPLGFFESRRSGEVVSRMADIKQVNQLVAQLVLGLPGQFCIAIISFLWMLSYSVSLSLAALLGYSLVLGLQLLMLPALHRRTQGMLVQAADNQGFLVEIFRSATLLKTTSAAGQAWEELQRDFGRLAHLSWNLTLLDLKLSTITNLLGSITTIALLWYGSSLVLSRQLSIGQLLAFNGMGTNILLFLGTVGGLSQEWITSRLVLQRLEDALHHPAESDVSAAPQEARIAPSDPIECRAIHFHHPGRLALIEHLDLRIPGGITTALIGESGCGKSTLSKLIAGLYPLQSGSIHYGPFSSRDLSLPSLRRQVVLLPQEETFLNRSIVDNFLFAYPSLRFDEIVRLCQLTLADDFIRDLPQGYGTILGEFGTNLSGGQRQRLALARVLASDPPILFLDESTSALDPVLESRLMDRLLRHRQGKTTVLVSHRPAVIMRADWIIFMDRGRIRQQNHPHELRDQIQLAPFLQAV